jgi:DNA-binding response OmpR family regulator
METPLKPNRRLRILVVDDEADIRNLIKLYLKDWADTDLAQDGKTALEKFALYMKTSVKFDLVLLDVMMPDMNGRLVLEKIRALETARGIERADGVKIIMLTALDDTANVLQTFKHGCDSYMVKPFDDEDLFREIKELGLA